MRRCPSFSNLARLLLVGLGLSASVVSTGCSAKDPIMRVQGAYITGGQIGVKFGLPPQFALGVTMMVQIQGQNDNGFDIQIRGVRGKVSMLNGRHVLPVSTAVNAWLQADSTTAFQFPVAVSVGAGLAILRDSYGMTCVPYTFNGVADVTATSTFKLEKDNYPVAQSSCIPRAALLGAIQASGQPGAL